MKLLKQIAFVFLFTLACASCNTSGTRHVPKPGELRVRKLFINAPLDVRDYEIDYIKDAVERYLVVIENNRHSSKNRAGFYPIRVYLYRTSKEVNDKRYSLQGTKVLSFSGTGFYTSEAPNAFLHNGELHVFGGRKWQIPAMAHFLWHIYEVYDPNDHRDLRFPSVNTDGSVVDNYLWQSR